MNKRIFLTSFLCLLPLGSTSPKLIAQETASHPISPFETYISGTGIVEPSSESISIGTPVNRIVEQVFVKVGQEVKKGQPLFRLESRDLLADLKVRQAAYEVAVAKLKRLESMPREEDIEAAEASQRIAETEWNQAKEQYEIVQGLRDSRAISREDINRRRFRLEQAEANLQRAKADLNRIKAGTWRPDLEIAHLEVLQAQSNVDRVKADLQRTIIRSPIDGTVLQVRIHEGELTPTDSSRNPAMIVGNIHEKHLLVSINQFDAAAFRPEASAVAFLRGNASKEYPLEFIQVEPFLVNKQNLTNEITERVDTRVLQVTYKFKETHPELYVGQQMDVFIETSF